MFYKLLECFKYEGKKGGKNLLAFQLATYFICEPSQRDFKNNDTEIFYESMDELGEYLAYHMGIEKICHKRINEARQTLEEIGLIKIRRGFPLRDATLSGKYRDKKHWFIKLNIDSFIEK